MEIILSRSFSWIYICLGSQQTGAAMAGNIQKYYTYFWKEHIFSHGQTLTRRFKINEVKFSECISIVNISVYSMIY